MKSLYFLLGALACLLPTVRAAEAVAGEQPSVAQILDRYVEATGGRAALEKLRTRVMKGNVEVTALGASGQFSARSKVPDRQVSVIDFSGFGSIREGFDGTNAWTAAPLQGTRLKTGSELARVRRSLVFPRELKLESVYDRLEVRGPAKVNEEEAWLVEAFPKEGKPDRLYFGRKTGLLLREETSVTSVLGEMNFRIDLGDYRVVDGVKVAFLMKVPEPAEMGLQIRLTSVQHNVEMQDAEFAPPKD